MTQAVPTKFALDQNYPNPFNPETNISFYLSEKSEVNLAIYNILGQKVRTLAEGPMESGSHTVTWNGKNESGSSVASGIYFYKLNAGDNTVTKKMTLLK
ncbi:MAG: T9SS type A sorting domain-containing protein [candidate division Zixibacteria bacterium]|nr:T9SS type A sorting domain-containing protein [candidate division Zixibacteria bacterium]